MEQFDAALLPTLSLLHTPTCTPCVLVVAHATQRRACVENKSYRVELD